MCRGRRLEYRRCRRQQPIRPGLHAPRRRTQSPRVRGALSRNWELAPVSEEPSDELVTLDNDDADALWDAWAPPGDDDILAHAAFERTLRAVAGLDDEGLYF